MFAPLQNAKHVLVCLTLLVDFATVFVESARRAISFCASNFGMCSHCHADRLWDPPNGFMYSCQKLLHGNQIHFCGARRTSFVDGIATNVCVFTQCYELPTSRSHSS